jgi:predicted Rossmann fold nucleotide-binding protein DprA/Smf involved in DNA uptake
MKEFDVALKAVAEGLRTIAQGMEKIAEKLEDSTPKKQAKSKPARNTVAKPKKAALKKAPVKKALKETAAETVLKIIAGSKKGVNSATLMDKTGFDKKKIANIVFKLRKQGKIKSVDKGVYTKA